LGQHEGSHQVIDLGDGNGPSTCRIFYNPFRFTSSPVLENETAVIRYDYGDPSLGTCQETIQGGNHFRYWVQNGSQRNSSAVFMAFSYEHSLQGTCSPGAIALNATSISLSIGGVKCVLMTCRGSLASNFYQRTILSSRTGIILAGKPLSPLFTLPARCTRIYPPYLAFTYPK
jgi:hypothetical protein